MREDTAMNASRPIRVMQVVARMNVGGPAVLVADLMRSLNSVEFESVLVTGFCDENESDYLDQVAVDIQAIKLPGFGRSISATKDIKAFFLLVKEIRKFKPDVIHTHTAKAGVLGRLAAVVALPRAKRIHTYHGHLLHGYFNPKKVKLIVLLEKILGVFTYKIIAIGNIVKNDLLNAGIGNKQKFEVIYPGLQELLIHPQPGARKILGLDNTKIYLVFVGRLTQIKRPDRLIELARFLKQNKPEVHLLIAGAGELLEKLHSESEAEKLPITFLGWRNDIGVILSASNIALLCSDNEGIPLTLIQASQAGLPIVSTDVGSVSDIVVDGSTGLLTEVSTEGLIQGVSVLLADPALGIALGKSGQSRAKELFSSAAMVSQHGKLYSHAI
jgi:glycosyltransferase involved in cell wall biosynthesis